MKLLEYLGFNKKKAPLAANQIDVDAHTIYELGQRVNNEDYYYPQDGNNGSVFVVCDGVGGAAKGEVASQMAAKTIYNYLSNCKGDQPEENIQKAIDQAITDLFNHAREDPLSSGLGTTATLVWFVNGKAYLAHVGDSRIYFFRDGEVVYESRDHSMVNDLIASGIINAEQAKHHPRRNVITKALSGKYNGPDSKLSLVKASIHVIPELYENDEILLCTDGILESYETDDIKELVGLKKVSVPHKLNMIKSRCQQSSKDNHTLTWLKVTLNKSSK